MVIRTR